MKPPLIGRMTPHTATFNHNRKHHCSRKQRTSQSQKLDSQTRSQVPTREIAVELHCNRKLNRKHNAVAKNRNRHPQIPGIMNRNRRGKLNRARNSCRPQIKRGLNRKHKQRTSQSRSQTPESPPADPKHHDSQSTWQPNRSQSPPPS